MAWRRPPRCSWRPDASVLATPHADVTVVDANPDGTVGDYVVGTVDVFCPGSQEKIGTAGFKSLEADRGFQLLSAAVRLKRGDIFLDGLTSNTDGRVVFDAIVGGTRTFAGARGEARERSLGEGDDTSEGSNLNRVTLKFRTENARTIKKQ
jgi:hypothetical protein